MKKLLATLAAAGIVALLSLPANAETKARTDGIQNAAPTELSSQRRHWRHRHWRGRHWGWRHRHWGPRYAYWGPRYRYWGPRYRYWGPRYGYYRPYRPYWGPGVSVGFWGGPRFGVWF